MRETSELKKVVEKDGVWWLYRGDKYSDELMHGNACAWITPLAEVWCKGKGADIGAGRYPFKDAVPIRDEKNNAYNLSCFENKSLDYVFSSHCLEHLREPQTALAKWVEKLKPEGYLFLYLPHHDMKLWHPGSPVVKDGHKWIPTWDLVALMLERVGLHIVDGQKEKDRYWSFWIVAKNG